MLSPKQKEELKIQELREMYEKLLPILDLMHATQINVSRKKQTQTQKQLV